LLRVGLVVHRLIKVVFRWVWVVMGGYGRIRVVSGGCG